MRFSEGVATSDPPESRIRLGDLTHLNRGQLKLVGGSTDARRTHYSGHKRDLSDRSPALLDGCNGLRTRFAQ